MSRPPLKATAYVSPTVQQGPPPSSTSSSSSTPTTMSSSLSLQSFPSSGTTGPVQPLKPGSTNPLKGAAHPRTSLPRPASFVGTGGMFRPSKIAQPTRRRCEKMMMMMMMITAAHVPAFLCSRSYERSWEKSNKILVLQDALEQRPRREPALPPLHSL
ncbi:hypothetical protein CRUP_006265 [Coryphaenoides rupestris]|nr:hypothetical protein CRUP_006265 [Coryphaenoides rupestris]